MTARSPLGLKSVDPARSVPGPAGLDLRVDSKVYGSGVTGYRISGLAERTGFSASTLRYYEQVGLLSTERTPAGYRSYGEAEVTRLRFIARAKQLGLPLEEIRELVQVWDRGLCSSVKRRLDELLAARSGDVAARIDELTAFDRELTRARDALAAPTPDGACDDTCGFTTDGPVAVELGRSWQ